MKLKKVFDFLRHDLIACQCHEEEVFQLLFFDRLIQFQWDTSGYFYFEIANILILDSICSPHYKYFGLTLFMYHRLIDIEEIENDIT